MQHEAAHILPSSALMAYRYARRKLRYEFWRALDPEYYPQALSRWYTKQTGLPLNLDNPQTYDEKIQWLKLYDATPEKGRLSDKYMVRQWVAERVGQNYLVPLLGVWEDPAQINFDALPNQFVLKATHGCGWNIIVPNKAELNVRQARMQLREWLALDYSYVAGLELQYRYCKPRIIAEAYLENRPATTHGGTTVPGDLFDYKFFCFKGKVRCIGFIRGRHGNDEEACFDRNWNLLPCVYCTHPRIEEEVPRPEGLDEAIRVAEALAEGFEHVRVDLYLLNDGSVRFGEMTFTTLSGISHWDPPEYNYAFGELIDMNAFPAWRKMHP